MPFLIFMICIPVLKTINRTGIGPGGLGGTTTALAVNVNTYPTHIAGLEDILPCIPV